MVKSIKNYMYKSNLHDEFKARRQDKVMVRIAIVLTVITVLGFVLCVIYQVPING